MSVLSGLRAEIPESVANINVSVKRLRLVFCTYPSVYSDVVLDELLQAEGIDLVGVIASTRVLKKDYNHFLASARQIQQSGFRYATYLFVVTSLYAGLRFVLRKPTLHQLLAKKGIPVLSTQDVNDEQGLSFLQQQQPDFLLSAHFNQLIKAPILATSGLKCLNIHPSLLPAYKGVDPAFYVMLRREQVTGVTVHLQDQGFDSGEVLEQQQLEIRRHNSLLSLNMELFKLGAMSAVRHIAGTTKAAIADSRKLQSEEERVGNYDSWPDSYDVKQFRQKRKFFRWKELFRFARRP